MNASSKFSFLFNTVKKNMGFLPESMKAMSKIPALLSNFTLLSGILIGDERKVNPISGARLALQNSLWSLKFLKKKDRIPLYLRNLIGHVSSNASGCRYCQAHTIGEAAHNGASEKQLKEVWDFQNSDAFNAAEKAALNFAFAGGSVPNQVTEENFVELRKHYSEEQIVEIGGVIALFGFLNRWNDTFATKLEDIPFESAEKYLKKSGWEIGKHAS